MSAIGDLPTWQFKLGFVVLAILALWPALVALIGAALYANTLGNEFALALHNVDAHISLAIC